MRRRKLRIVLGRIAAFSLVLAGCGSSIEPDYSTLGLAEVSGQVTLDGQPVAHAVVVFEAPDTTYSYARADASGNYQLKFNSQKSGVLPGPKTVRIRTTGATGEEEGGAAEGEDGLSGTDSSSKPDSSGAKKELVPACYNAQSQLRVTVGDGSQTLNFHLKSDCSVTGSS